MHDAAPRRPRVGAPLAIAPLLRLTPAVMLAHTMMRRLPRQAQQSRFLHTTLVNVYCKPGTVDKVVEATVRASLPPAASLSGREAGLFTPCRAGAASACSLTPPRPPPPRRPHSHLALALAPASTPELSLAVFLPARQERPVLESRHARTAGDGWPLSCSSCPNDPCPIDCASVLLC